MGNQNVIGQKQEREIMKRVTAYVGNGAPAKVIAAECGVNWGLFQHYMSGNSDRRMLELTAKKLTSWLDAHDEYMPDDYRRCTKCGAVKPVAEFYKDSNKASGHRAYCAECARKYQRRYQMERTKRKKEEMRMANNNTEVAMTAEIVKKIKDEDKSDVNAAMLAPYFGITPKQLEAVRRGEWDSLLYRKEPPKPATDVKNAVEMLRVEIADMHTALNRLLVEMGCKDTEAVS